MYWVTGTCAGEVNVVPACGPSAHRFPDWVHPLPPQAGAMSTGPSAPPAEFTEAVSRLPANVMLVTGLTLAGVICPR